MIHDTTFYKEHFKQLTKFVKKKNIQGLVFTNNTEKNNFMTEDMTHKTYNLI